MPTLMTAVASKERFDDGANLRHYVYDASDFLRSTLRHRYLQGAQH